MGVIPNPRDAAEIWAAVSTVIALCSQSMKSQSKPHALAI
jgi:hypothetical protein